MKNRVIAMTLILTLMAALAAPAAATPSRVDDGVWSESLVGLTLTWLAEVLVGWATPDQPVAFSAAGNSGGQGGGDESSTTTCDICAKTAHRVVGDPDG